MRKTFLGICLFTGLSGIYAQPPNEQIAYSVFLIGDAGEHKPFRDAVLDLVLHQAKDQGENSAVVFLGDNIYPVGLPPENDPQRETMEGKLVPQLEVIRDFPGPGFIIPGNHDWAKGKEDGPINLKEQQDFTQDFIPGKDAFFPKDGCPGPVEVALTDDLLLVLIDSQWLLTKEKYLPENSNCRFTTRDEVLDEVQRIVVNNLDRKLIIAAHHPIYTYGSHGGVYQFKQHIFPLTDMNKSLYIPLPVLGSFYPLYRKSRGNIQDATNSRYRAIMDRMVASFEKHPKIIHVAGHEHALEHARKSGVEYIVSGSGAKTEYVKKKGYALFVSGENGFSRVNYYSNEQVWMEFWAVNEEHPQGRVVYKTEFFTRDD